MGWVFSRAPLLVVAVLWLTACGDDHEESVLTPRESCEELLDLFCGKRSSCEVPTDRTKVKEDCLFILELEVDCAQVQTLGAAFSSCKDAVMRLSCPVADEWPPVCTE